MDKSERQVLQDHHMELINDIYVTSEFLCNFYQAGLFDSVMIEEIGSEKENASKVAKLLTLLKTRGPQAFTKFVNILEIKHDWIAKSLMSSLNRLKGDKQKKNSTETFQKKKVIYQPEKNSETPEKEMADNLNNNENNVDSDRKDKKAKDSDKNLCSECQKNVCAQCQTILQSLVENNAEIPQKQTKSVRFQLDGKIVDNFNRSAVKKILLDLCIKLKIHTSAFGNSEKMDDMSYTDDTKTFDFLEQQIDCLLNRIKTLEEERSQCYQILGEKGKKKSLVPLVDNLSSKCLRFQKQLMDKGKTEEICRHLRLAQSELQERYDHLQERCKILKMKNEELSKVHTNRESYHVEKQKTLKDMHDLYDKMKKTLDKSEKTNQEKSNKRMRTNTDHIQSNMKSGNSLNSMVTMETNNDQNSSNLNQTTSDQQNGEMHKTEENENQTQAIKTKHSQQEIARLKKLQAARDRQKALLDKTGFIKFVDKAPPAQEAKTQSKGDNSHIKQSKTKTDEKPDKIIQGRPERPVNIRTVSKNPFYHSNIKNLF